MPLISKNECVDKLDDIVNKYNNIYHRTIDTKPFDIKSNTYIDYDKEIIDKDPKFKIGDIVRISRYKNIFEKVTPQSSQKRFLWLKKFEILCCGHVINDLNREEVVRTFHEKDMEKKNQKEFRIKKVIKRKSGKLYVKWNRYNNSFNSWIDKKEIA